MSNNANESKSTQAGCAFCQPYFVIFSQSPAQPASRAAAGAWRAIFFVCPHPNNDAALKKD
jgi:hypothetical protein